MTAHEKAVNAVNARLERLQANLREATLESSQRFLFQSVIVMIGVAEALNDYIRMVGRYAERRHGEIKQANESLGSRHDALLHSGKELLEQFKANPGDRELRKQIEGVQQEMAAIQKTVRRGANALQRDLAPGLAQIDELALTVRRFSEAEQSDALQRVLSTAVGQVRALYASHPVPDKDVVDAAAWEKSGLDELKQAVDFYDAYSRIGYQVILAIELMTLAVSDAPPATSAEAGRRGTDAVVNRLKEISGRFSAS